MRDRLSTKILSNGATRYGVYDETGNLLRYEYIKLEDEPTVEGDLFSKANMLPDSIPKLLGLKMENPQVKDALNVLANVGNLHVWERVQSYSEPVPEVPAGYTLGEIETNVHISSLTSGNVGIRYGDSVTVSNDGTVSISNSSDANNSVSDWGYSAQYGKLDGKFCTVYYESGSYVTKEVFFYPSGAYLRSDSNGLYATKLQRVTGYPYTPAIPAGTTTDYLTSTDRNAYPDKSAAGGRDAYYTLGDVVSGKFYLGRYGASTATTYKGASAVSVDPDGIVSLSDYYDATVGNDFPSNSIEKARTLFIGRYVMRTNDGDPVYDSDRGKLPINEVVYIPDDATVTSEKDSYASYNAVVDKYQPVHGHAAIPDNITITYLGQLGEPGAKIEIGSYIGTGTYGSKSANSLTADFPIKLCIVGNYESGSTDCSATAIFMPFGCGTSFKKHGYFYSDYNSAMQDQNKNSKVSSDGKTLTWYDSRSAQEQLNVSPRIYYYVLIS